MQIHVKTRIPDSQHITEPVEHTEPVTVLMAIYEAGGVHYKMNMDMTAIQMNAVYHLILPEQPPGCKSQIHQILKICQRRFLMCKGNKEVLQLESIRLVKCLFDEKHELLSSGVQAETVVLNTCFPVQFLKFTKTHSLYFCHVDQRGFARPRWGVDFKTGFDILDSELLLLHSRKSDILTKIQYAYTALGGKK